MRRVIFIILLVGFVCAGWDELIFSSPQDGMDVRQGGNVTLALNISNIGMKSGYAVYIINVTLMPGRCINEGRPVVKRGLIICPANDPACYKTRFPDAPTSHMFYFENLTIDEGCQNGSHRYEFLINGNVESIVGGSSVWSETIKTSNPAFSLNFIGPPLCGDGECTEWKENCSTCPDDCGLCPVCIPGEKRCERDDLYICNESGFWEFSERCGGGCYYDESGVHCLPPCQPGDKMCLGPRTLGVCVGGRWINSTCSHGCLYDRCRGGCEVFGCPDKCEDGVHFFNGTCERITGDCSYKTEDCPHGCDEAGIGCLEVRRDEGLPYLPIVGGLVFVIIGVVLYLIRKRR